MKYQGADISRSADIKPSELFHENSKHHRSDRASVERIVAVLSNPVLLGMMAASQKRYPSAPKISLSAELPPAAITFDEAVWTRRSCRKFTGEPLRFSEVSKLLRFACGVSVMLDLPGGHRQPLRVAPSGGGLYPVEAYLVALKVDELSAGLYHYNPVENHLEVLRAQDFTGELLSITFARELKEAAALIVLTGIPVKTKLKYGERGYRFLLLEAGHIAQNILLTANSLRLGALPIGGFVDDRLDELLGLDGLDEVSLYLVAVGRQ